MSQIFRKSTCILLAILMLFLTGCSGVKEGQKTGEKIPVSDTYEMEDECKIFYADQDEILSMLKHGTGIVIFSWKGCPWCHKYISILNEAVQNFDTEILYYDIYEDREEGTDFYNEVVKILEPALDEVGAYDASGKPRIYVPDVTFVSSGKIIGHDNESSMISEEFEDIDAAIEEYWAKVQDNGQTSEYNLKKRLTDWCCEICAALKEIESRGCTSCPATKD